MHQRLYLLVVAFHATLSFSNPIVNENATVLTTQFSGGEYALPVSVTPTSYDIRIKPYFENAPSEDLKFRFEGEVFIQILVKQSTNVIRMHAHDMDIDTRSIVVAAAGGFPAVPLPLGPITQSGDDKQFLDIQILTAQPANARLNVYIKYTGKLNDELDGFYRSSYVNYRGETKWLGVTQFEATGARRAFPCFDEPSMKARFTLHIAREPLRDVTANMKISKATDPVDTNFHKDWVWVDFQQSVEMPTYLVAFAVHDFGYVTHPVDQRFRVIARREFIDSSTAYALDVSPKILTYLEDFTGIPYDAAMKVDQIALPDFAAGAMENWGLITYREVNLLHDKFFSSASYKQRVVTVIAHELAHQWFGNLVSPQWWSEIWLNEGFATYFEYFATDKAAESLFQLQEAFIMDELQPVLESDSKDSTHPMTTTVTNPASAAAAFDNIAYNKGAVIVRFLIHLMGQENFKSGITDYLTNNMYKSVTKDLLWDSLAPKVPANRLPADVSLKTIMDTWVDQPGYPVMTVTRNYEKKEINFKQERFFSSKKENESPERWFIPITMVPEKDTGAWTSFAIKGWLKPNQILTLSGVDVPEQNEWIVVNPRQIGYYRVNYDEKNWNLILATLNSRDKWLTITDINRAQLIDDSMALAKSKYVTYETALSTTEYLNLETYYLPWNTALKAFSFLGDRLIDEKEDRRQFYTRYVLSKLSPLYNYVSGFTMSANEGHVLKLQRNLALYWSCNLGHDNCRSVARTRFQEWKKRSSPDFENPIDPDLRSVIYCHGMADAEDFNFLFTRYTKAKSMPSEMSTILTALGCAPNVELLNKVLEETIKTTDSLIRSQDTRDAFVGVLRNPMGVEVALDFLMTKFAEIKVTYQAFGSVTRLFAAIAPKLNKETQKAKLNKFLTDNPDEPENIKAAVRAAISIVDENIAWLSANKESVLNFFEKKVNSGSIALISPLVLLTAILASLWA